jgi:hypothetical protein
MAKAYQAPLLDGGSISPAPYVGVDADWDDQNYTKMDNDDALPRESCVLMLNDALKNEVLAIFKRCSYGDATCFSTDAILLQKG